MMDITPVMSTIITLMFTLITAFLIPYLRKKYSKAQLDEINLWVVIAVKAAEQLYQGTDKGAAKKKYVIDALAKHGFKINMDELEQMIEAAVNDLPWAVEVDLSPSYSD